MRARSLYCEPRPLGHPQATAGGCHPAGPVSPAPETSDGCSHSPLRNYPNLTHLPVPPTPPAWTSAHLKATSSESHTWSPHGGGQPPRAPLLFPMALRSFPSYHVTRRTHRSVFTCLLSVSTLDNARHAAGTTGASFSSASPQPGTNHTAVDWMKEENDLVLDKPGRIYAKKNGQIFSLGTTETKLTHQKRR